ncbi:MAG: hypothetical protein AAB834_01070 [Patescibacteria group bacterium]
MKLRDTLKRKPHKNKESSVVIDLSGLKTGQSINLNQLRERVDIGRMREELEINNGRADLKWKRAYYGLRAIWGYLTIALLAASLGFAYWLVESVGTGRLDFRDYKTFLNIIAGTLIVDVLGLVAIVMHFLFPGEPKRK